MKKFPLPPLPRLPKGYVRWGKPRRGPLNGPIEMGSYHITSWEGPGSWDKPRSLMGDAKNTYIIAYRTEKKTK